MTIKPDQPCPCGGTIFASCYASCCQPMHLTNGHAAGATAEMLMRSRFSAYALGLVDYLVATTAPQSRDKTLAADIAHTIETTQWLSLDVLNTQQGGINDKMGKVTFLAHYLDKTKPNQSKPSKLHERSRFKRYEGRWVYVDGELFNE